MTRALVVYYSRTGVTEALALGIADLLGADRERLVDHRGRAGLRGYARASVDALLGRLTEIDPPAFDPSAYDVVVLGTPVWNASVSSPVRTYVAQQRSRLSRVALFCTCDGLGGERALAQLADLCGKTPVATLVLPRPLLERGGFGPDMRRFADEVTEAGRPQRSEPPLVQLTERWQN